jgi:heat-inducible transcriptional repressor
MSSPEHPPPSSRPALSERDRRILAALVREYIERGDPVSSLWLAQHGGITVSSATVRNVLTMLEESGYVRQPHPSAGRVPTDLAYRYYVDQILEGRRPARPALEVEARIREAASVEDVLDSVSQELSRSSQHLGFALALASDATSLGHIEFVPLDAARVLVIVVSTGGQVLHKAVGLGKAVTATDLRKAADYINREFSGCPLGDIRDALAARIRQDRALFDRLLSRTLQVAASSLATVPVRGHLVVHGASSLVDVVIDEESTVSMNRLRGLLSMIDEKHRLIQLLTEYLEGPGLTVVIGGEHVSPELRGYSLVASASGRGNKLTAVGVIGPTRMRYPRAISAVESASAALERVLGDSTHAGM